MAAATLVVTQATKAGILSLVADANVVHGNVGSPIYMPNDGRTILVIWSVTGDIYTFTPTVDRWGRIETLALTCGATTVNIIGPFPPDWWNNSAGQVTITPTTGQVLDHILAVRV